MSQEPEQEQGSGQTAGSGQSGGSDAESPQKPAGGPAPGGAARPENETAPERPKYSPPSYVPPVDADKDANATEPIPSHPTRPLPRDLPPGAPPLPGTVQHGAGQGEQGPVRNSGEAGATPGQPAQPQPTQPHGYPGYPTGARPGQPAGYPGQQYPGAGQQYPSAAQPYSGQPAQPYPPQGYPPQPYAQGYPGYPPAQAYGQPVYYAPMAEPKGLSIASMVCGIAVYAGFGFLILPQIAAVVLGHMGLAREPGGRGFAIAGLVMGYVGIALTLAFLAFFVVFASSISQYQY